MTAPWVVPGARLRSLRSYGVAIARVTRAPGRAVLSRYEQAELTSTHLDDEPPGALAPRPSDRFSVLGAVSETPGPSGFISPKAMPRSSFRHALADGWLP